MPSGDSNEIVNGTTAQEGLLSAGVWANGSMSILEAVGNIGALVVSGFPRICRIDGGVLLANPVPVPSQLPASFDVYARGGQSFAPWSTPNPPPSIANIDPTREFLLGSYSFTTSGSQVIQLDLDSTLLMAARDSGFTPGFPAWDGSFALHLHGFTADGTSLFFNAGAFTLRLNLSERVFTGIEVPGPLTRLYSSRPDQCPICGDESLRETWVWCALHERRECPRCADPGLGEEPQISNSRFELVGED